MEMSDFVFLKEEVRSNINKFEGNVVFKNFEIINKDSKLDDGKVELLVSYTIKSLQDDAVNTVKIVIEEN